MDGASCNFVSGAHTATTAKVVNSSTYKVQAVIRFLQTNGTQYTRTSVWSSTTATATADTTMVVNRWGRGSFLVGDTQYVPALLIPV